MHGQVIFKNNIVNEITIKRICHKQESFDKKNPYIFLERTKNEYLICEWDYILNVFYDGNRRRTRAINGCDSLQVIDLLKELSITKKAPMASYIGITQKEIRKIKHKCYKNHDTKDDENSFFKKNAIRTDFDSIMLRRFNDFDSNSILLNTAHHPYIEEFHIIVCTEKCNYTYVIRNHPTPLTPIICYEEQFDLDNPSRPRNVIMYSVVNYSIQKQLSDSFQGDYIKLFKKIQSELCLLYQTDIERVFEEDINDGQFIWR